MSKPRFDDTSYREQAAEILAKGEGVDMLARCLAVRDAADTFCAAADKMFQPPEDERTFEFLMEMADAATLLHVYKNRAEASNGR